MVCLKDGREHPQNMTERTKTWPQLTKDRLAASQMLPYIMGVIEGKITKPCPQRLATCIKMLNKVMPDLRAIEHSADQDSTFTFIAHLKDGG